MHSIVTPPQSSEDTLSRCQRNDDDLFDDFDDINEKTGGLFSCNQETSQMEQLGDLKMFPFKSNGFLLSGELYRINLGQEPCPQFSHGHKLVTLFRNSFPKTCLLETASCEIILSLFLKDYEGLEAMAEGVLSLQDYDVNQAVASLRDFLSFVRHVAFHFRELANQVTNPNENSKKSFINLLQKIHLNVGSLSDIETIIAYGETLRTGTNHLFTHLFIEVRWTLFEVISILSDIPAELNLDLDEFQSFNINLSERTANQHANERNFKLESDLAIQLIYDGVQLSLQKFKQVKSNTSIDPFDVNPFLCSCHQEFMLLLIRRLENRHGGLFWNFLKEVFHMKANQFSKEFLLWLLPYFVVLSDFDATGKVPSPLPVPENAKNLVDEATSAFMSELSSLDNISHHDSKLRLVLRSLCVITYNWGLMVKSIKKIWEFIVKILDSPLVPAGSSSIAEYSIIPHSSRQLLENINFIYDEHNKSGNVIRLFCKLIQDSHVSKRNFSDERKKNHDRLKAQILSKLSPKKLKELNEYGWIHMFLIILHMQKLSQMEPELSAKKWLEVLNTVKNEDLSFRVLSVICKCYGALALLVHSQRESPKNVLDSFMLKMKFVLTRSKFSPEYSEAIVTVWADLQRDIVAFTEIDKTPPIHPMLDSCIAQVLRMGPESVRRQVLACLSTLTAKVRRLHKRLGSKAIRMNEEQSQLEEALSIGEALWRVIFPVVKDSLCASYKIDRCSAKRVAEFITAILMLSIEMSGLNLQRSTFLMNFSYFAKSRVVQPLVSCQFLIDFLQLAGEDMGFFRKHFNADGNRSRQDNFDDTIISGWLRCVVNISSANDADLIHSLSTEIFRLPIFRSLKLADEDEDEMDSVNVFTFIERLKSCEFPEYQKYVELLIKSIKELRESNQVDDAQLLQGQKIGAYLIFHFGKSSREKLHWVNGIIQEFFLSKRAVILANKSSKFQSEVAENIRKVLLGISTTEDQMVKKWLHDLILTYYDKFPCTTSPLLVPNEINYKLVFLEAVNDVIRDSKEAKGILNFLEGFVTFNQKNDYPFFEMTVEKIGLTLLGNFIEKMDWRQGESLIMKILECGERSQQIILPIVKNFINTKNISFNWSNMLFFLKVVKKCNWKLLRFIEPDLRKVVDEVIKKRGGLGHNLNQELEILFR